MSSLVAPQVVVNIICGTISDEKIGIIALGFQWMQIFQFIESEWRNRVWVNFAIIGFDHGLPLVRRQAIIWTNTYLLALGTNIWENLNQNETISIH